MFDPLHSKIRNFAARRTTTKILLYGFISRLIGVLYSIVHDNRIEHIKYTDIDYHVFTNGSTFIAQGASPYEDKEFRYSPVVALIFMPNVLLTKDLGKFVLIFADILCGNLLYKLNIAQGTNRLNSKIFLMLWLFNPLTIAISTRGSFEPILSLVILSALYLLVNNSHLMAGLLYGLAIHLKLYPIIYALPIYIYLVQKKPYLKTQSKVSYWIKTLSPKASHLKFFSSSILSLALTTYLSYRFYGREYLEQSFLYHMKRKDLQHNFSIYFYIFRLFPRHQQLINIVAFLIQFIGVLGISILYLNFDMNRHTRLRKLTFTLFSSTFIFVSLNKVCTAQYFSWYIVFLPLVLDCLKIGVDQAYYMASRWLLSQVNWLVFAYLYEYQKLDVLNQVGNSSILFLISNIWILSQLCLNTKWRSIEDERDD